VYNLRGHKALAATAVVDSNPQLTQFQQQIPNYIHSESHLEQQTRWNSNWDNRSPSCLLDHAKYASASDEDRVQMMEKVTATATRNILLIRHGQYHLKSEKKNLTELGREQATLLGKRMAISNMKFDRVVMSTMNRATETATLALAEMSKEIPRESDSIIEEGAPYPPEPAVSHWLPRQKDFFIDGARIEAAFRKYIHRASPKQKDDSFEVIICHANVIRYFVCRTLQFPPEGWLRLSSGHTAVTWLVIRPNGNVSMKSFGDVGHLPAEKISFS